jgi:hypothetical protein
MVQTQSPDTADSHITTLAREVDSRESDGIHIQLLWYPHDDHITVAVNDSKTGQRFELEIPHRHRALDVFHHPYAYAAETRDRERTRQTAH